jgi:hypothetical protein
LRHPVEGVVGVNERHAVALPQRGAAGVGGEVRPLRRLNSS